MERFLTRKVSGVFRGASSASPATDAISTLPPVSCYVEHRSPFQSQRDRSFWLVRRQMIDSLLIVLSSTH